MSKQAVIILLACVALAVVLWYVTDAGGAEHAQQRAFGVIEVTAQAGRRTHAVPPEGRRGDRERLRWLIYDRYGRRIGTAVLGCRWPMNQARFCNGVLKFPLGTLAVVGTSETRQFGEWSVVSGSGRYYGARGQLEFRAIGITKLILIITI